MQRNREQDATIAGQSRVARRTIIFMRLSDALLEPPPKAHRRCNAPWFFGLATAAVVGIAVASVTCFALQEPHHTTALVLAEHDLHGNPLQEFVARSASRSACDANGYSVRNSSFACRALIAHYPRYHPAVLEQLVNNLGRAGFEFGVVWLGASASPTY